MKRGFTILLLFAVSIITQILFADKVSFPGSEVLGSPTANSITVSVLPQNDLVIYYTYGNATGAMENRTDIVSIEKLSPVKIKLENLEPDTRYYYQVNYKRLEARSFSKGEKHTFHTQRANNNAFSFAVISDARYNDPNTNLDAYAVTLKNINKDQPDFIIDLGDAFMNTINNNGVLSSAESYEQVAINYREHHLYYGRMAHSTPLFFVNGKHEGEFGPRLKHFGESVPVWAAAARRRYYATPEINKGFYTGSVQKINRWGQRDANYAWKWGCSLHIVLDPYSFIANSRFENRKTRGFKRDDGNNFGNWQTTLGDKQYAWLKKTLKQSNAKYKFIYIHQINNMHGGAEAAAYYEWGGLNADRTDGFEENRPDWNKPLHDLFVEYGVNIVFHGHDKFFAKQYLEGIIYQLVPKPNCDVSCARVSKNVDAKKFGYSSGDFLFTGGHLRVNVSPAKVNIELIISNLGDSNGRAVYKYSLNQPSDFTPKKTLK
ncbi:MAG: metallophosphoesterase family protein [Desulfobacteraceae bacterium]|nr:metallophosphoesterase family protein [Desulfobacteraceae bacterium]